MKSGQVGVALIRDLKSTLEREKTTLAAFITLDPPTAPMVTEATTAGFYSPPHLPDQKYARIQLLTI